jgi:DNA-binding NarL/FixJ family response regulator
VLVPPASDEDDDVDKALRPGASGYLLRDTALQGLSASVRLAAGGDSVLSPAMAAKLVAEIARPAKDDRLAYRDPRSHWSRTRVSSARLTGFGR